MFVCIVKDRPSSQGTVSLSALLVVLYCGSITAYRYRQVPPGNPLGLLYTIMRHLSMPVYLARHCTKYPRPERHASFGSRFFVAC